MATYGNSSGNNAGKKYQKLTGLEVATPQAAARAQRFLGWYAAAGDRLSICSYEDYDRDVAAEAMILVYDAIAFKNVIVKQYKFYFLRTYHTLRLASIKRRNRNAEMFAPLDGTEAYEVAAPDFDYSAYEATVQNINAEILDYVRGKFDPVSVSIFEMYVSLKPEMSCKKLADMLGLPLSRVTIPVGVIKEDVVFWFSARKEYLMSLL